MPCRNVCFICNRIITDLADAVYQELMWVLRNQQFQSNGGLTILGWGKFGSVIKTLRLSFFFLEMKCSTNHEIEMKMYKYELTFKVLK